VLSNQPPLSQTLNQFLTLSQYDSRRRSVLRPQLTIPKAMAAIILAEPGKTGRWQIRRMVMLAAEHEAAEVLRLQRLKAYGFRRAGVSGLSWLFEWLGLRAFHKSSAVH
jgi:hypothetical protein